MRKTTKQNARRPRLTLSLFSAGIALCFLGNVAHGQQNSVPQAAVLDVEQDEIRRYSVELIVFEYADSTTSNTEVFPPDVIEPTGMQESSTTFGDDRESQPDPNDTPVFDDTNADMLSVPDDKLMLPTFEDIEFDVLERETYALSDVYNKLVRLDAYKPLMHLAWTQRTVEKDLSLPIKLRQLGDPPLRLGGTVTLYLGRYLHLVLDLALEETAPVRPGAEQQQIQRFGENRGDNRANSRFGFEQGFVTPSIYYRIQEDRIVRNGELRYYDHPKFGVIAKIVRADNVQPNNTN